MHSTNNNIYNDGIYVTQRAILTFFNLHGEQDVAPLGVKFCIEELTSKFHPSVHGLGYGTPKLKNLINLGI